MKQHLRRLIAPTIVVGIMIFPLTMTEGQRRSQKQRANQQTQGAGSQETASQQQQSQAGRMRRKSLEGVGIRKNMATLKPGYKFVQESENVVAVSITAAKRKKKKGEVTGNLKCGCVGQGGCSLSVSKTSVVCKGDCSNDGCTLLVTVGEIAPAAP